MTVHTSTETRAGAPARPLAALLWQLASVIGGLTDAQYRAERAREVSGSIGGHVRHCLDHVEALVTGIPVGKVNYDSRRRGTAVETSREAALAEIQRLVADVECMSSHVLSRPLEVLGALDTNGAHLTAPSSVARELAFVVSHTIHHLAVVALLLHGLGVAVPPRFGYAPSTPTPASAAA
jgi:uncharacterized damage-inducible protein DinB